jgi:hypothetical protein
VRLIVSLAVACMAVVAGCAVIPPPVRTSGAPVDPSTGAVETFPRPALPSAPAAFTLNEAPSNLGCDSIGWPDEIKPYTSLTFHIDPGAEDQVRAVSDTGRELVTYWEAGFVPGKPTEPLIRDPDGQVVAHDGEVVAVPPGWNLHGHFVCMSPNKLYVMLTQPG